MKTQTVWLPCDALAGVELCIGGHWRRDPMCRRWPHQLPRNRRGARRGQWRKPTSTNWWGNRWTFRPGRMRGAPIVRSRKNQRRTSFRAASSGWTRCIARLITQCPQKN